MWLAACFGCSLVGLVLGWFLVLVGLALVGLLVSSWLVFFGRGGGFGVVGCFLFRLTLAMTVTLLAFMPHVLLVSFEGAAISDSVCLAVILAIRADRRPCAT